MRFELFGTKIYVSFLFSATICIMLATDRTGLVIPTLFASLIHEVGHLFSMWASDCAPKEIRLIPATVQIIEDYPKSRKASAWILLCGPLANTAVFAALYINSALTGSAASLRFAIINAVVAAFNLMPVTGLDGGRLLVLLLLLRNDEYSAVRAVNIITAVFAAAAFTAGAFLAISGTANLSVFIVALYLAVCVIIKR